MKRSLTAIVTSLMFLTLVSLPSTGQLSVVHGQEPVAQDFETNSNQSFSLKKIHRLTVDVATDARTFRLNRRATLPDAVRGDSFIVEGKIYPGGTILPGGTLLSPGPFNPDLTGGQIGKWVLRGTFNYDFAEIMAGAEPAVFGTQYFLFDSGEVIITEGAHAGLSASLRAVAGGVGTSFTGGECTEQLIGTNITGLFNQRFSFKVTKN